MSNAATRDLRDERLLVTGASRGIGRAIALAAARRGAHVLVHGRAPSDALDASVAAAREAGAASVRAVSADLAAPDAAAGLADELADAPLFALVHSAGVCPLGPLERTSAAELDLAWQVNLRAPYLLTARLLPALRAAKGHVVFVNSGAGKTAKAGWSAYAATKHGLRALADSLRDEVGGDGVRVTTVYPGRTATDMQAGVRAYEGKSYDPADFVRPEDVARVTLAALETALPSVVDEVSVRPG